MDKIDEIRRKMLLPDGWGRSTVGGRTIVTKPSAPAVAVSLPDADQLKSLNVRELEQRYGEDFDNKSEYELPLEVLNSIDSDNEDEEEDDDLDVDSIQSNYDNMQKGIKFVENGDMVTKFTRDMNDPSSIYRDSRGRLLFDDLEEQERVDSELVDLLERAKRK